MKIMKKTLVISNYNWDLGWLSMTYDHGFSPENTVIYDKSDSDKDLSHFGKVIKSPNVGANQFDILRFIIENYEDLPDLSVFVKGNLFKGDQFTEENYYTTEERFVQSLNATEFFSIWVDKFVLVEDFRHTDNTPLETLKNGRLIQPVAWCNYSSNKNLESRYFSNHHQVLDWCFIDPPKTDTIEFIPASNFAVTKEVILKYSKTLYEKLISILYYEPDSKYDPTCAEAHILERLFYLIWNEDLVERD